MDVENWTWSFLMWPYPLLLDFPYLLPWLHYHFELHTVLTCVGKTVLLGNYKTLQHLWAHFMVEYSK